MAMRDYVFGLLTGDSDMNDLGITVDSGFIQHDVDTPQVRPFMTIHWGNTNPGIQGFDLVNERDFQVWVHDAPGDYTKIDNILSRIRVLLMGTEATYTNTPGRWITGVEWMGDSDDLNDDEQDTITRYGEFRLIGSAA